jgi:hypothetical protein
VVAVFVWMPGALAALIVALLTFSSAYSNPMLAARVLALVTAALIVLAPAIPLVAQVFLTSRIDPDGIFASLPVWAQIVKSEGLRLVTGHGFDSAVRALANGYLPARAPRGILFEVWYELGALGAIGLACVAWNAFRAAGHASPAIAPFLLAALACALTIAIAGLSVAQLWWVTLLAVVGISFAIALRAHHREQRVGVREASTRRPAL